ncbi:ATP-binding protein [Streptomyces sioyaensis]|uniref:LuxR family transcriptional regulator n=2 Tax=Streptomyces sioyaensis TaxID=67364 RepID=A0A4Q1QYX4_9ACTN|nr:AAA family ATPase [Streptomyces sioyaensis]RXS68312.1 LuxR family transcriptional regulator [Streptomyces sioyaensis]
MLLDRDTELDLTAAALRSGRGALVLVSGPLGVGKSALLDGISALGAAQGAQHLRVSAAPMERDFSLGAARQLLEPALRDASPETRERWTSGAAGPARCALDAGLPGGVGPSETVLGGLTVLLANMASDQPVLMLVDELQWADPATLAWLRHLSGRLADLPVVLVCAVREGETLTGHPAVQEIVGQATHTLRPGNLALQDTHELIRRYYGEAPDEAFAAACHRATGGNPLFLSCLLADAAPQGLRPTADNAEAVAALRPASLQHRLMRRLDARSKQVRRVARAVAVLGDATHPQLLTRLAEVDSAGLDHALRQLTDLGLTTGMRLPRFVHALVQSAVAEGIPLEERTVMHALAAESLHRAGLPPEQVARHLMTLTTPTYTWATEVLRAAAFAAQRRGAPEVAAGYLRRALMDSSPDNYRAELLIDLATAERSFAPYASVRHIAQAVLLCDGPIQRAQAVVRLAPSAFASTLLPVHELLREAADALGPGERLQGSDRELALRLEARVRQSTLPEPEQLADSVARLVGLGPEPRTETVAERELLAPLLGAATFSNALPAHEVARVANRVLQHEPTVPAHVHTTMPLVVASLVAADSVDELDSWLGAVQENAAGRQTRVERAMIGTERALVSLARGRLTQAKEQALAAFELAGAKHEEVFTLSSMTLAACAILTGDHQLADRLIAVKYRAEEDPYVWSGLAMLKGQSAARKGDLDAALGCFLDAGRRLEQCGWLNPALLPWASAAAFLHLYLGDHKQARELSALEVERARAWGAPGPLGRALRVHSHMVEGPGSVEVLREAVDVLHVSANRFELCQALLDLGEHLGPADARGRAALRQAHAEAVGCDTPWLARRAEELLAGAPPDPETARGQLTPAEWKVAEQAASGRTNQMIADELNITCRAVEKHLTNCYRKMSIPGRAHLGAVLEELDRQPDSSGAAAPS